MSYKFGDLSHALRTKLDDFDWGSEKDDDLEFLPEELVIEEPSPDVVPTSVTWCGPK